MEIPDCVVRLRQMEESRPAACDNRLGAGRRLRTVTTSPFGKIKMLGPPVPYELGVKVAISGPDGDCGG